MKLGVRSKLFLISLVVITAVGLSSAAYLEPELRGWLNARIESELHHHAQAAEVLLVSTRESEGLDGDRFVSKARMNRLADRLGRATESRITIIDRSGTVLGDSALSFAEVEGAEDHSDRPEFVQAFREGKGVARRYSTTVDEEMMYVAVPWEFANVRGVARASLPAAEVDENVATLRLMLAIASLIGLAVAVLLSVVASNLLADNLRDLVNYVRRTASGEARERPPLAEGDDMISGMAGSLNRLSDELSYTVDELARERNRLEAILENMSEAVIAVDRQRRVTLINRAAYRLLDIESDPIGRPVVEILRAPGFQELLDTAEEGAPASKEFELGAADTKQVLAQASPPQETVGTVVVMHDVTELRRLETMRRDFVANVSHELRTPVSIIRATAETLQQGAINDPKHAERFLDALIRNSERLGRLIGDLLEISRIEAGEYDVEAERLMLRATVEHTLDAVAPRAEERDIELELDIDDDVCVMGEPQALDQVLLNLVGNAVKYTDEGGHVTVRASRQGGDVRVEVVDDGPGIPHKHRDRIFERFYRVDAGRSREVGGTGLGLSIVKHLVSTMDGEVGYEPARPRGSIFWFRLPGC